MATRPFDSKTTAVERLLQHEAMDNRKLPLL